MQKGGCFNIKAFIKQESFKIKGLGGHPPSPLNYHKKGIKRVEEILEKNGYNIYLH